MLEVRGFHGLRFNAEATGDLSNIITPPYDVITPIERERLAARSPYNMVHLILPEDRDGLNKYAAARDAFEQWQEQGILQQDAGPSFYLLRQRFTDLTGMLQERRSFFAVVNLPESGERRILGHERTFDKPVEDRLRLTEATRANLGPVFLLYQDPDKQLASFLAQMDAREPDATARTIDGVSQELWHVKSNPVVTEFFTDKTLYIADGHHRFRTAAIYRDQMRQQTGAPFGQHYDYVLAGFVAFDDPGLQIYPPHRLVPMPDGFDAEEFLTALEQWFEVTAVEDNLPERVAERAGGCAIGVSIHETGNYLLVLRDIDRRELLGDDRGPAWRDLDMAVLHRGILERILNIPEGTVLEYEKNVDRAMKAAQSGAAGLAFILRTIRPEQIRDCAESGEPMPQKSTYFYPKLPSGGVIHLLY
ncbi:MAG: DUF1015 domain-containing protein [Candidatus Hydrogenedentes bacterium]|nr:DUF1015 domain-containing protein [Candidatus Hydrogenedentota bacterium]